MGLFDSIKDKVKDILPDQAEKFLEGQGKDQIVKFIMDKVQDGKQTEAKQAVNDAIKQTDGKLDSGAAQGIIQKIQSFIKPEYIDEVKNFIMQFVNKGK